MRHDAFVDLVRTGRIRGELHFTTPVHADPIPPDFDRFALFLCYFGGLSVQDSICRSLGLIPVFHGFGCADLRYVSTKLKSPTFLSAWPLHFDGRDAYQFNGGAYLLLSI